MSAPRVNYADPRKGTNTSDHTYQSAMITLVDSEEKPLMALKGCTWNLLNYGISLKTNGVHQNNPWDFDEDHTAYLTRKTNQLNKILAIISSDADVVKNDFFLLQEVDIFFPAHSKLNITPGQQAERDALTRQFTAALRANGWEIILRNGSATQQALVMLYHCKSLQPIGQPHGVLPTSSGQCRGLAQAFTHLPAARNVTIVDLHLDYAADYSTTIPGYQKEQTQQDQFTIMGGDTNHAPNQEMVGLINTWTNITNISGETYGISHHHKNAANIIKCYDGFFANPTRDTSVRIIEQAAEVFVKEGDAYIVKPLPANPHVHRSAPGQPWRRGGYSDYLKEQEEKSGATAGLTSPDRFFAYTDTQSPLPSDKNVSDHKATNHPN